MEERVNVINMTSGQVGLIVPELHYERTFPTKGAKIAISKDVLREGIYNYGVLYLFKTGMLYIDDIEFRKELGLEPEDADEPTVSPLEEKKIKRMLTVMPASEFKVEFAKLAEIQQREVAEYAVNNEIVVKTDKANYIKKLIGVDILKAITLRHENEEEITNESDSLSDGV